MRSTSSDVNTKPELVERETQPIEQILSPKQHGKHGLKASLQFLLSTSTYDTTDQTRARPEFSSSEDRSPATTLVASEQQSDTGDNDNAQMSLVKDMMRNPRVSSYVDPNPDSKGKGKAL